MTRARSHRAQLAALRVLVTAGFVWVTAAVCVLNPAMAGAIAIALWSACAVTIAGIAGAQIVLTRNKLLAPPRRVRRAAIALVFALMCAATSASIACIGITEREVATVIPTSGGRIITVEAIVVGKTEPFSTGEFRFEATSVAMTSAGVQTNVPLPLRVIAQLPAGRNPVHLGSRVTMSATAYESQPGDRAVFILRAGDSVQVVQSATGLWALAARLREGLTEAARGLPAPGGGLVPGLAVGDTAGVTPELNDAMRASSLSHLTAVSGANCALVVGAAYGGAALCGASRRARLVAGVIALGAFVALVTPEPSVVRAAVMGLVAMTAVALGRSTEGLSILTSSIVVILILDPWLAVSLGFALSSTATLALIILARPLASGLSRWMPEPLALIIAVPLAAQIACGPILIMVDPSVPLYGVLANLLAGPAAPAATVLGLLACLALPFPALQLGLTAFAWLPAAWIAGVAEVSASLPGSAVIWQEGPLGVIALALTGVFVGVAIIRPWHRRRWARIITAGATAVVVTGAGIGVAYIWLAGPGIALTAPPRAAIIACDVGQGDAVLIRSEGRIALIDTGPDPALLATCLNRFGIDRIDLLILTHFDLDHIGGLSAVTGRVGTLLHGPLSSPRDSLLLASVGSSTDLSTVFRTVEADTSVRGQLGGSQWKVLWPPEAEGLAAGNDASLVVEFTGGGVPDVVFLGDLGGQAQQQLLTARTLSDRYDVVKVAHHGSADQQARLYEQLGSSLAIISVGADNTYGHPRQSLLQILQQRGMRVARTDQNGTLAVSVTEHGTLTLWTERP